MRELLNKLKCEYGLVGAKLELESEEVTLIDALRFGALLDEAGLDFTVKIGGCGCVNDIVFAHRLGAKTLISPMVESRYALEKFYHIANKIGNFRLNFNLETIVGFENLDDILKSEYIKNFDALIFGRTDFCASLNNCPYDKINRFMETVKEKIKKTNLELIIGGGICADSTDFLKNFNGVKFETRKLLFAPDKSKKEIEKGLELALEFEILWLESKTCKNTLDEKRIQ